MRIPSQFPGFRKTEFLTYRSRLKLVRLRLIHPCLRCLWPYMKQNFRDYNEYHSFNKMKWTSRRSSIEPHLGVDVGNVNFTVITSMYVFNLPAAESK